MLRRDASTLLLTCSSLLFLGACGARAERDGALVGASHSGGARTATQANQGGVSSVTAGGATFAAVGGCVLVLGGTTQPIPTAPVCGDGRLELKNGEDCEDGNLRSGDGCSSTCRAEPGWLCTQACAPCVYSGVCGDGTLDALEECDDGNRLVGDGCSRFCELESGAYDCQPGRPCTLLATCGNGLLDKGEECDPDMDASVPRDAGTACTTICTRPGYCGDGKLEPGEGCDERFNKDGICSACTSRCEVGPYCGDGVVQKDCGEVCDEGRNTGAYGACAFDCTLGPHCGDSIIQPEYEECDTGEANGRGVYHCDANCKIFIRPP